MIISRPSRHDKPAAMPRPIDILRQHGIISASSSSAESAVELLDIDTILEQVQEALARGDWRQAVALVEALRPPDQADPFSGLYLLTTRWIMDL